MSSRAGMGGKEERQPATMEHREDSIRLESVCFSEPAASSSSSHHHLPGSKKGGSGSSRKLIRWMLYRHHNSSSNNDDDDNSNVNKAAMQKGDTTTDNVAEMMQASGHTMLCEDEMNEMEQIRLQSTFLSAQQHHQQQHGSTQIQRRKEECEDDNESTGNVSESENDTFGNDPSSSSSKRKRSLSAQFQEFRSLCGSFVNHPYIQTLMVALIVVNALLMGVSTSDAITDHDDRVHLLDSMDQAFLIGFTIELFLQFVYRGRALFTDGWLVFDFVILVSSWSFEKLQVRVSKLIACIFGGSTVSSPS
jgi:Ion transport protein